MEDFNLLDVLISHAHSADLHSLLYVGVSDQSPFVQMSVAAVSGALQLSDFGTKASQSVSHMQGGTFFYF